MHSQLLALDSLIHFFAAHIRLAELRKGERQGPTAQSGDLQNFQLPIETVVDLQSELSILYDPTS